MARAFRNTESLETEKRVRAALIPFLEERGFAVDDPVGSALRLNGRAQLVRARDEQGHLVTLWVKLCWRKNAGTIEDAHSAAQLMARVQLGDWTPQIQAKVNRAGAQGATHLLLVQNSGEDIWIAASIPLHVSCQYGKASERKASASSNQARFDAKRTMQKTGRVLRCGFATRRLISLPRYCGAIRRCATLRDCLRDTIFPLPAISRTLKPICRSTFRISAATARPACLFRLRESDGMLAFEQPCFVGVAAVANMQDATPRGTSLASLTCITS